jgi:hypothetical protein
MLRTMPTTARSRRSFSLTLALLGLAVVVGPAATFAAPEPDPVPRRWQLDLDVGALRLATIESPDGSVGAFWYLTYTVTNTSGTDILFAPAFELVSEDGIVHRSGRDVPANVTRSLLERLDDPFLLDQISIVGLLLQGEENAKQGLAIWPAATFQPGDLTVYAGGFSGEIRTIQVPDPATGKLTPITLRKTMMIRYDAAGELDRRGDEPLGVQEMRWILR